MAKFSLTGRVVFFLFGATLIFIGGGLLFLTGKEPLYGYWRTRAGVTAEAFLKSVAEGRTKNSSTEVLYEYQFGGHAYAGTRISIFKPTAEFYAPLSAAFASERPITVFR